MLLLLLSCTPASPWSHAYRVTSLDQTIGGPKATIHEKDYVLENDRIRIGIVGERYSLGPSTYGGSVADVDLQRSAPEYQGGHGNDQFAEMFATVNLNLAASADPGSVKILADGKDGKAAVIRSDASGVAFLSLLDALWAIVGQPDFRITTDYILEPGSPALKMVTTASLTDPGTEVPEGTPALGQADGLPILDTSLNTGFAFGDFYLQGGAVDVFTPGLGFDEDKSVFDANQAGQNTLQDPFKVDFVAGVADGVSFALGTPSGPLYIPIYTSSQTVAFGAAIQGNPCDDNTKPPDCEPNRFPDGSAYTYTRYLGVGRGDVGSALDALLEAEQKPYGDVSGNVLEDGTLISLPHVSVLVYQKGAEYAYSQWLSDVGDDTQLDGSFGGHLPPGEYELQVHQTGRPDGPRVPITVVEGESQRLTLTSPRPGQVHFTVVDETGRKVPAKITVYAEEGTPTLDSSKGDPYIGGAPAEVWFAPYGETLQILPPGEYHAVASRGTEYELGESGTFTVGADGTVDVPLQVVRSVLSNGWITADFHVHAIHSFDSGVQLTDRVVTMACEGVDFFTSSDHDSITDYAPVVEDMGMEPWIKTGVGLETTTLEIGHFISFPLAHDTIALGGGAFDWTGYTPQNIFEKFDELGEDGYQPVRMVPHPRDGILGYFDQYGYNPYTGEVQTPLTAITNPLLNSDNFSLDFDALELLNGKRFDLMRSPTQDELDRYKATGQVSAYEATERTAEEQAALIKGTYTLGYGQEGQIDDWFTFLNRGYFFTALANSDTHGKFSVEAGCPHNYVMVDQDDPQSVTVEGVADAVKAGRVVASYGPFIEFWIDDPNNGVGSTVQAPSKKVTLHVHVEAPTWMAVDRAEIYQNGTMIAALTDLPKGDVLRIDYDLPVTVDKDSWFVVEAMGNGSLAPVYSPVEMPPVELQDVVTEALGDVPGVGNLLTPASPVPRTGEVFPFAITNPIWVDVDGGEWTPPGLASWMVAPKKPE